NLKNNVHHDMTTCVAYFRVVSMCNGISQHAETAANYKSVADQLLDQAIVLGREVRLSDDAQLSRIKLAAKDMMRLIEGSCANISSLLRRYMDKCTAVFNDPLKRLREATQRK